MKHRDAKTQDAKEKMQGHFGKAFRSDLMRRAEADVKESLLKDERSLWRYLDQKRRKQRETMRQKPQSGTTKDNVKNRENPEKSDGKFPNEQRIV